MHLFDGKFYANKIKDVLKRHLLTISTDKTLAIVLIGKDPASLKYVRLKEKLCQELGITVKVYSFPASQPDAEIYDSVRKIFSDSQIGGGIIQLPLPRKTLYDILNVIPENKDIDLLSKSSLDAFYAGDLHKLSPVVRSFDYFLTENGFNLSNKRVTIIGYGELVGKPLEFFCKSLGATTHVINSYHTGDKIDADLLILSAGVPNLVKGECLSAGCSVIDFGSSVVDGKSVGDLDLSSSLGHLNVVSPSPGGVGPLVVCFLIKNFLDTLSDPLSF